MREYFVYLKLGNYLVSSVAWENLRRSINAKMHVINQLASEAACKPNFDESAMQ